MRLSDMQLFHSFVPDLVVNNTESTKRPMVPLIGFLPSCAVATYQ